MKEQIIEWCKRLEWSLNLPDLHSSTSTKPKQVVEFISNSMPNIGGWRCMILVNRTIIYKQVHLYSSPNETNGEEICIQRIMQEVFNFGVMASKEALEKIRTIT